MVESKIACRLERACVQAARKAMRIGFFPRCLLQVVTKEAVSRNSSKCNHEGEEINADSIPRMLVISLSSGISCNFTPTPPFGNARSTVAVKFLRAPVPALYTFVGSFSGSDCAKQEYLSLHYSAVLPHRLGGMDTDICCFIFS